jgi:hypothetical protein
MTGFDRDRATADALLTDGYLDALLADAVLTAGPDGGAPTDSGSIAPLALDPSIRGAADRLRRDLTRVHPSFRFEERLATRLAEAAVAMRMPLAAGANGGVDAPRRVVAFPQASGGPFESTSLDDLPSALGATGLDAVRRDRARPLLIGGALTSAAISLAGAAWVAWRHGRPRRSPAPIARAARAVRDARTAIPGDLPSSVVTVRFRRRAD